jgi:hypothetical protein
MIFGAAALLTGGASAVAGVVVAVRRTGGFAVGTAAGLLGALYPCWAMWRYDEEGTWPDSLLIFGGAILVGSAIAGSAVAWMLDPMPNSMQSITPDTQESEG